jgi:hypothetical protein
MEPIKIVFFVLAGISLLGAIITGIIGISISGLPSHLTEGERKLFLLYSQIFLFATILFVSILAFVLRLI